MAVDPKLAVLEKRLLDLEKRIFGDSDKDSDYPKVIDTLSSINAQVSATAAGRPNIDAMFKRLPELDRYLDIDQMDQQLLTTDVKLDMILPVEDDIREQAAALEKIEGMCDVLGSEHIKVVPGLQSKLYELSKIHIQQQDEVAGVTEEAQILITKYNNIITLLSKQFAQWDEMLTRLELRSKPAVVSD